MKVVNIVFAQKGQTGNIRRIDFVFAVIHTIIFVMTQRRVGFRVGNNALF